MNSLEYKVKTLSPVIISDNGADVNFTPTKDYLTGTAILGFFAGEYIRHCLKRESGAAHQDERFRKWFLSGGLVFANGHPMINDGRRQLPAASYSFDNSTE